MTTDCRYEAQVPPTVTLEAFVEAALALADDYEAILGMVGSQDPDRRRRLEVLRAGEAGFVDAEAYTQAARGYAPRHPPVCEPASAAEPAEGPDPDGNRDSVCPRCGHRAVELIHGVPNAEGYRLIAAGDRARGFSPETLTTPTHVCKGCGHYYLDEDSYSLYARMRMYERLRQRREKEK